MSDPFKDILPENAEPKLRVEIDDDASVDSPAPSPDQQHDGHC